MKRPEQTTTTDGRKRGMALVTVVSVVTILTILVIAMLSLSQSERSSSVKYADGEHARSLGDSAISMAMGQIWEGTRRDVGANYIWASQPGAVRKYTANGAFYQGFKLYSDDQMVVNGSGGDSEAAEKSMAQDTPDTAWSAKLAKWVDLNEPVIRPDKDADGLPELIFPIIDPRGFIRSKYTPTTGLSEEESSNIEGFTYETAAEFPGIKDAESVTSVDARLPMPVQWLYVLKDGRVGTLDDNNVFVAVAGGAGPTEANPIVGRVAFWTDDESSKLNINTASEPTFWSTPMVYHDRDYEWAVFQPTRFEYQRYPGHPATVALSTVLFPNREMDAYGTTPQRKSQIRDMKERIYEILPKINRGGSETGTVPFWASSDVARYKGAEMTRVDIAKALKKHLYASVDELLFSSQISGGQRLTHDSVPGASVPLFKGAANMPNEERALERMRFFLTAHSRSPETNLFGLPRIAMWPVANEAVIGQMRGNAKDYRTVYDNLIAYCNTLGSEENSYFFRRADSVSPTNDFSRIARNRELLEYLHALASKTFPSGGMGSFNMDDKYPNGGLAQILVQMFDYIRSTNLYDGVLAPTRQELITPNGPYWMSGTTPEIFGRRDTLRYTTTKTFTPDRAGSRRTIEGRDDDQSSTAFPGHGQVTPIQATIDGNQVMGFGRFPVLSEIGFHFICTADGNIDNGSYRIPVKSGTNPDGSPKYVKDESTASGGKTSSKITDQKRFSGDNAIAQMEVNPVTKLEELGRWYSNYAPYPGIGFYGTVEGAPEDDGRNPKNHPGFKGKNWNVTLERGKPLNPGQKRIQGMLSMEMTVPSSGYTGIYPDFTIEIMKLPELKMAGGRGGIPLFNTLAESARYWRAPRSLFTTTHNREMGASIGPAAFTQGRHVISVGEMQADPSYNRAVGDTKTTYEGETNYDLVTSFFTVSGDTMTFKGGSIQINVYTGRSATPQNLVQTYNIDFAEANLPVPELVVLGAAGEQWTDGNGATVSVDRIEAPRWWAFNYGGAIGRFSGTWDPTSQTGGDGDRLTPIKAENKTDGIHKAEGIEGGRTLGRFFTRGGSYGARGGIPRFDQLFFASAGSTYGAFTKPRLGNPSPPPSTGAIDRSGFLAPEVEGPYGQDVVFSMVPKHGDIRLMATKREVPAGDWEPHPAYGKTTATNPVYMAHSFMRFASSYEQGIDLGTDDSYRLVNGARYTNTNARPDLPLTSRVLEAQRWGDFDSGSGSMRDGPWINRPDEGNTGVDDKSIGNSNSVRAPTAYYDEMWRSTEAGEAFVSPNRMVASPGMFGSLPTGSRQGVGTYADTPWQTLLFRPWIPMPGNPNLSHKGSPNYGGGGGADTSQTPFRGVNPADHLFMDLFWMPVVEPYAISEAFSTAGKVNMNYQMVPFGKYIRRATGLHAVLKGELLQAYPISNAGELHGSPPSAAYIPFDTKFGSYHQISKWTDIPSRQTAYSGHANYGNKTRMWHRKIDIDSKTSGRVAARNSTLGQFDDRFNFSSAVPKGARGLFRTASQICEIHMVPKARVGDKFAEIEAPGTTKYTDGGDEKPTYSYKEMSKFWEPRAVTGDNVKERVYTTLYGKLTTQSNTFRVHYRAQSIKKARSVPPNTFNPSADSVSSDYRGSAIIERRLDPEDPRLPNYGSTPNAAPLDNFYNFRVLENKRFAP